MPNVFATQEDCHSKLGKRIQYWRACRPDEWLMDEFIREAEKLDAAFKAAKAFIDSHVADPDLTNEMIEKYAAYEEAIKVLDE